MKHICMIGAACLLASCAGTLTPRNCHDAGVGLNAASQLTALFIHYGANPVLAQKLADDVSALRITLDKACASVTPPAAG